MEIYLTTTLTIDQLAALLRDVLNLPRRNRTEFRRDQRRTLFHPDRVSYDFEVLGLTLLLVPNIAEARLARHPGCAFYVAVSGGPCLDRPVLHGLAQHLASMFVAAGIDATVDAMTEPR